MLNNPARERPRPRRAIRTRGAAAAFVGGRGRRSARPARALLAVAAALALSLASSACHTMRFELTDAEPADGTDAGEPPASASVYHRRSFFAWGLAPTMEVDVAKYCPHGALAIREQTTFVDGLCAAVTLGIWEPRSSWYTCRAGPEAFELPADEDDAFDDSDDVGPEARDELGVPAAPLEPDDLGPQDEPEHLD